MTKHQNLWKAARNKWLKENPPNHEGYYICYLCSRWIPADQITLDHVIPRSHAPGLRYEQENIRPACYPCNSAKGSKSLDQHTLTNSDSIK